MRKREGGCPNRCRCVAPSQRRRWVAPPQPLRDGGRPNCCGTAVVPTAAERRLPQPLREGGCPNRYRCMAPLKRRRLGTVALPKPGRAVVPTATDAWHRSNDGDWGQSPSQGPGGRVVSTATDAWHRPTAADTSLSLKRPITPPRPTPLAHSASAVPSTHR